MQINSSGLAHEGIFYCRGPCLCCPPTPSLTPLARRSRSVPATDVPLTPEPAMALPRRPVTASDALPPARPWTDPEFRSEYPSLAAFLSDYEYSDKSPRVCGSISLTTKRGELTATVSDKDRKVYAIVVMPTWAELLFVIDEGICNDSLDWKADRFASTEKKPPF